jgi:trigger factor
MRDEQGNLLKPNIYLLTVKKVEKVNLPDINEEFVRKVTKDAVTRAEEFHNFIRHDLEQFWAQHGEQELMDTLTDELVKRNDFPVPESLVKAMLDSFVENVKTQQPDKKLPPNFNEEEFRKEYRANAIWQAKWMLIREQIIAQEGLKVEDADVMQLAEAEAERTKIAKERLINYYKTSEDVANRILSNKVTRFLRESSVVTERYETSKAL